MTGAYGSALFPQHADKLAASAIDPAVAAERGYVSADTRAQLERYGFGPAQRRPPALIIPLHGVTGALVGHQLRPDEPRMVGGRTAKYETKLGQPMVLDVPPRVQPHLGDPARPLVFTEGPLKADAAVSAGLDCVALLGVWSWRGTNGDGGKTALPDFEYVALNDRQVYVAFDSDAMLKEQVHGALVRLGALLAHRGAHVAYVYLPHGDGGAKVGLDDYLASGRSADDLLSLATGELRRPASEPAADTEEEERDTFDDLADEPGHVVLDDLASFIRRFVAFPLPEQLAAVALWIMHTHTLDAFDHTPRLVINSPEKQCGKSRLLEVAELTVRRPRLNTSMSPAYMFRVIEQLQPCLLVDEVDSVFGTSAKNDHNEDLRGLINSGFRRGNTVGRVTGEGAAMTPKEFPVFAPVALAGIGNCLPDTVLDRSVIIRLRRRGPDEAVEPMRRRRVVGEADELRRRVAAWAHRHLDDLADADPAMPDGLVDRAADTWEPLLALADAAGGTWPSEARNAAVVLNARRAEDDPSLGAKLLADLRSAFGDREAMFSAALVEALNNMEESPWGAWHRGSGFTTRDLARRLREFGVRSKNVRAGSGQAKGYAATDLADAWARYLGDTPTTTTPPPTPRDGRPNVPREASVPKTPPVTCTNGSRDGGTAERDSRGAGRMHGRPTPEREVRTWD